jgi:hypothetical protein
VNLTLTALEYSQEIEIKLEGELKIIRKKVGSGEEMPKALDKIFQGAKLDISKITVQTNCQKRSSPTSCRLIQAARWGLSFAQIF